MSSSRPATSRDTHAVRLIGAVSLAFGTTLAVAPRRASHALGLPYSPPWTPVTGSADVALGAALICGRHRPGWMHVRALANLALAGLYAAHLSSASRRRRTRAGLVAMVVLTLTDGALARRLPTDVARSVHPGSTLRSTAETSKSGGTDGRGIAS